jgi:methylase of polypeptide subunit release factors
MSAAEPFALTRLLQLLSARGYRFIAPTPETHRRVLEHPDKRQAKDIRDVFGWSLWFAPDLLDAELMSCLEAAAALQRQGGLLKSQVRVASLGQDLFVHSAFPPHEETVFFGPDTYRFAELIRSELGHPSPVKTLVEIGAGSGAGALVATRMLRPERVVLTDVNPLALAYAEANAAAAGVKVECIRTSDLDGVEGPFDVVLANPPFMGAGGPTYQNGGGMFGAEVSLRWAMAAASKLAPGGRLILYTASAIVGGEDLLRRSLERLLQEGPYELSYRELDPDIFGEALAEPAYRGVERIAAVGAVVSRPPAISAPREALEGAKTFLGQVLAGAPLERPAPPIVRRDQ